jgi:hypothetical protein
LCGRLLSCPLICPRGGQRTLEPTREGFRDRKGASTWNVLGVATGGPLARKALTPVDHVDTVWFGRATRSDITFSDRQDGGMPSVRLTRRAFVAAGGGLLVAAIAGGGPDVAFADDAQLEWGLLTIDPYASTDPQRFGFALETRKRGFASGPKADIAFAFGARAKPKAPYSRATLHAKGLPKKRRIYTVEAAFPQPGPWQATVKVNGQRITHAFQVQAQPQAPVPGTPAPRVPSPTVSDAMGVDPICTRNPPCPLHQQSLSEVLGAGKPAAVMFATPALCQSRYCGPVLNELLTLVGQFEDRITFVHVEIYTSLDGRNTLPAVQAWGLPGEPFLFGVDATGNVVTRLDGAFAHDEQQQLLQRLVS